MRKFNLFLVLAFVLSLIACASIPLPKADQTRLVSQVGCSLLQAGGCFDALRDVMPGIDASTCDSVVGAVLDLAVKDREAAAKAVEDFAVSKVDLSKIDLSKISPSKILKMKNPTCKKLDRALGVRR
jgi:hypothetical protein